MKRIAVRIIEFYQKYLSILKKRSSCRFYPTCSEYTRQAIIKYGLLRGTLLGAGRILRCHPFNDGGYDPLK